MTTAGFWTGEMHEDDENSLVCLSGSVSVCLRTSFTSVFCKDGGERTNEYIGRYKHVGIDRDWKRHVTLV